MIFGLGPAIGVAWIGLLAIAGAQGAHADVRFGVAIAAYAIAIGAALGSFASGLAMLRARLRDEPEHAGVRAIGERFAIVVTVHSWVVLGGMARTPQLYDEAWYARGALRRTVQVLATDVLGPGGVAFLGLVAVLAYLFGSPSYWTGWRDQARRSLTSIVPRARRSLPPAALAALSCALLGAGACSPKPRGSLEHPNVLVIVVSSLRPDRLDPRVAPHLAQLAARGARFDRAYATIARTMPSMVTLLTGRDPHHHGVRSSLARWDERAKDFDALPSRFAHGGYATTAVSDAAGDVLRRVDLGFARVTAPSSDAREIARRGALARQGAILPFLDSRFGRDLFPAMRGLDEAPDADALANDAIGALDRDRDRPFLLTVLFSTAHPPYAALSPWYARFTRAAYRGRFKYDAPLAGAGGAEKADDDDVAQERALYDGAIASVDAAVGRVIAAVDRRGLRDRTVIVLAADHGEALHENAHGRGHGDHLFGDEGTHVPLVVIDPRSPAVRAGAIVRDVDLAPTLYALAGVAPPADLDGRSLAGAVAGEPLSSGLAFGETELWRGDVGGLPDALRMPVPPLDAATEIDAAHGGERVLRVDASDATRVARHRMVREDRWKLVYAPTRGGPRYLLFDTESDPGETHDVAAAHPDEVARLEALLWKWMLADPSMTRQGGLLVPRDRRGGAK